MVKLDIHEITATGKRAQICITMPLLLIWLSYRRNLELIILKSLTYPRKILIIIEIKKRWFLNFSSWKFPSMRLYSRDFQINRLVFEKKFNSFWIYRKLCYEMFFGPFALVYKSLKLLFQRKAAMHVIRRECYRTGTEMEAENVVKRFRNRNGIRLLNLRDGRNFTLIKWWWTVEAEFNLILSF